MIGMENGVVVKATGLGKKYTIGHRVEQPGSSTLRDTIGVRSRATWRRVRDAMRGNALIPGDNHEEIWALNDVDFEITKGDIVGIIGKNGAGKSTLLKVLARITDPTAGRVEITGRVASLLQVGTGFHPELTGGENVYLNGAILGMKRAEIAERFDDIIEFAGVGQFVDTPVKRYSGGMYVRLAFAVAAHLTADILVVDEVLAMGDAEFQKKSLGTMSEVAATGRTILFVSHNANSVRSLCTRGIVLQRGSVAFDGPVDDALSYYEAN